MRKRLVQALRWLVFALAALAMNFPVLSTFVTSLKSDAEISSNASLWIAKPTLDNYRDIFAMQDRFDILHYLANSLIVSLIGSALAIGLAFPAAYAMARFGVGRRWLLPLVVNLRAVPLIIFAIPIYLMYQRLALLDTRIGLALILALVNVPLALVLFSTAIRELPLEIEEAARVDGAGWLQTYSRIIIPYLFPVISAVIVIDVISSLKQMEMIYLSTEGGPGTLTQFIAVYLYQKAFVAGQYGYGNALSVLFVIVAVALTLVVQRALRTSGDEA